MRVLHRCVYGKAVAPFGKTHVTSVGHVCGRHLPQSKQAFSKATSVCRSLCLYVSSSSLGSGEQRASGWQGPVQGRWCGEGKGLGFLNWGLARLWDQSVPATNSGVLPPPLVTPALKVLIVCVCNDPQTNATLCNHSTDPVQCACVYNNPKDHVCPM